MKHPAPPPVAITPLGPVSATTVAFRMRGEVYVVAVVKATFALVPEGRMRPVDPDPIASDEQQDPSGLGLRDAGDLAPYLGQCDVVVTGHAELPPGFSSPEVQVGLAVVQGGQVCIDKRIELDGGARVGAARSHVHIDGLGPLSRAWPRRSQLLGAIDPRGLHGPWIDIPDGLDWSYFQAAPADQRANPLRGDEWIALGGMVAQRPKLRVQLPEARGRAMLYRRERAGPRAGEPIELRADTVHVDVDRRRCSIVWRGHARALTSDLGALRMLAGVELPARAIAWFDPFAGGSAPPAQAAPAARESGDYGVLGETNLLGLKDAAKLAGAAATPFEARRGTGELPRAGLGIAAVIAAPAPDRTAAPARESGDYGLLGETNALGPAEAARLSGVAATPFEAQRAPGGTGVKGPPRAPTWSGSGHLPAAVAALLQTPSASLPAAAEPSFLEGTMALSGAEALAAQQLSLPATPFERAAAPAPIERAAVPERAPEPWPPAGVGPRAQVIQPPSLVAAPAPFPPMPPPGAPPLMTDDADVLPEGLGAQFLAALGDEEPPA